MNEYSHRLKELDVWMETDIDKHSWTEAHLYGHKLTDFDKYWQI